MFGLFRRKKVILTHGGSFHADDVFACATLELVLERRGDSYKVIRGYDPVIMASSDYVIDVGGEYNPKKNRYDHHQVGGAGIGSSGIPYASFGLIWKHFGEEFCGNAEVAAIIESELVLPTDAGDNGIEIYKPIQGEVYPSTLQALISNFFPSWREVHRFDEQFEKAVHFAKDVLTLLLANARLKVEARQIVVNAYTDAKDKKLVILNEKLTRQYFRGILSQYPEPLYVMYPKSNDWWGVETINKKDAAFEARKPFPAAWAGLRDVDLQAVTGVSDAVFCHNGRFLCVAKSKEGALALAKKALAAR